MLNFLGLMSESLIFNLSATQDACFDRLGNGNGTEIYSN